MPIESIGALERDPRVRYVQKDGRMSISSNEDAAGWGIDRIDQRDRPLDGDYNFTASGRGVNIYIADTGVRTTHRELVGRASPTASMIEWDGWGQDDCHGHGTHVAATAAGSVYGIAKSATVHSVRVLECDGNAYSSEVIWGVDWITANHVKPAVANMSLVGPADLALDEAVQNSIAAGVFYAVAAANYNVDACNYSPARVAEAITVGATNQNDERASFSNWGPCLDIFAPGEAILSANKNGDDNYQLKNGTSMATPHVAGVAALYLEQFPNATPAQVATALLSNASLNKLTLNAANTPNVLLYAPFVSVSIDNTPPSVSITAPSAMAAISGATNVTVNAADNDQVSRVELYAGGRLAGASTSSPFTISWDSRRTPNGSVSLTTKVFDRSGNRADSAAVSVTVSNTTQATYNATLGAPSCGTIQTRCDSFALTDSRGAHEPNQPNTLGSCTDGTAGT